MQLLRRVVTVDWPKGAEQGAKDLLIRTALSGHQKILADAAAKGLAPTWEAYANSPGNSNLESVVLPGPIVFNYRYLSDLIGFALEELRRLSPIQSGDYKRAHTIFVNDQPVGEAPKTINPGDRIFIANPLPYARKIEVGKTESGREFVISPPNRLYERVTEMVKAQGKGMARVYMGYVDLGGYSLKQNQLSRSFANGVKRVSRRQRPDRAAGSAVPSPAIFFAAVI